MEKRCQWPCQWPAVPVRHRHLPRGGSTQGIFPGGKVISSRKVPTLLLFWERSAKPEDQALVWGKAHGLLTDTNAGETVTRADMVRALYKLEGSHG